MGIKGLIVILICGLIALSIVKKTYKSVLYAQAVNYWRVAWIGIVSSACLINNYWLFSISIFFIGYYSVSRLKENAVFLYLFLLPALPMLDNILPGFGSIRMIFEFTYPRLLSLSILLPLLIKYKGIIMPFSKGRIDKYFILFLIYFMVISWYRSEGFTSSLRSFCYIGTDLLLPYFVVSRLVNNFDRLKIAFMAIVSSASILAFVNIVEFFKRWFVYQQIYDILQIPPNTFSAYALVRDGMLRATSVFESPIVFGFFMVIAIGILLGGIKAKKDSYWLMIFLLLVFALISTISRGPWVGGVSLVFAIIWFGQKRGRNLLKGIIYAGVGFILLMLTPYASKVINLLPFVGEIDSGNISYREDLFSSSLIVIEKNLFFGTENFLDAPELQHLIQGQGIIDVVNTYLQVTLETGLVGLCVFLALFLSHLKGLHLVLKRKKYVANNEDGRMVIALLAIILSIMVMIATVSRIDYIPVYYLIILALAGGVVNQTRKKTHIIN